MCLTCGCGKAHDDHGKEEYLTVEKLEGMESFKKSAELDDLNSKTAVKNTLDALQKDKGEHPEEYS